MSVEKRVSVPCRDTKNQVNARNDINSPPLSTLRDPLTELLGPLLDRPGRRYGSRDDFNILRRQRLPDASPVCNSREELHGIQMEFIKAEQTVSEDYGMLWCLVFVSDHGEFIFDHGRVEFFKAWVVDALVVACWRGMEFGDLLELR